MKSTFKFRLCAMLLCLVTLFTACGSDKLEPISTEIYDIHARLAEVESKTAPLTKKVTEDVFMTQTDMNDMSYDIYMMWQELVDEIIVVLEEQLSAKEYEAFLEDQAAWELEREEAVDSYVSEFAGGSIVPLLANLEMTQHTKLRAYDLAKYFTRP